MYIEQRGSVTLGNMVSFSAFNFGPHPPQSSESLATFIRSSGISNVELKDEDVQQILDTLIYDGKVDKVKDAAISIPVLSYSILFCLERPS